jgi:hypothetical protein
MLHLFCLRRKHGELPNISSKALHFLTYSPHQSLRQISPGLGEDLDERTTIEYDDEILFSNHGR